MSAEVTIWPKTDTGPVGRVNPGDGRPFPVLDLLGRYGAARIQFPSGVPHEVMGRYLRTLAAVATQLADEIDPEGRE